MEAEKRRAQAAAVRFEVEAANLLSNDQILLQTKLALLKVLPEMIRESARPLEAIDSIKIVQVDGFAGGRTGPGAAPAAALGQTCGPHRRGCGVGPDAQADRLLLVGLAGAAGQGEVSVASQSCGHLAQRDCAMSKRHPINRGRWNRPIIWRATWLSEFSRAYSAARRILPGKYACADASGIIGAVRIS